MANCVVSLSNCFDTHTGRTAHPIQLHVPYTAPTCVAPLYFHPTTTPNSPTASTLSHPPPHTSNAGRDCGAAGDGLLWRRTQVCCVVLYSYIYSEQPIWSLYMKHAMMCFVCERAWSHCNKTPLFSELSWSAKAKSACRRTIFALGI